MSGVVLVAKRLLADGILHDHEGSENCCTLTTLRRESPGRERKTALHATVSKVVSLVRCMNEYVCGDRASLLFHEN